MFKPVSAYLARFTAKLAKGDERLRKSGIGWLFAFEFIVVLLGVLAAQSLQNLARERELNAEVEASFDLYSKDLQDVLIGAQMWQAALPCVRERTETVLKLVADSEPIPSDLIAPLNMADAWVEPVGQDMLSRFRRHNDDDLDEARALIMTFGNRTHQNVSRVRRLWRELRRGDAQFGTPNQSDRDAVRTSAISLLDVLDDIGESSEGTINVARSLGISPSEVSFGGQRRRPARNCGEVWEHRSMMIPDGKAST